MSEQSIDLPQGTLDLYIRRCIVLSAVAGSRRTGAHRRTAGAKYYELTRSGRKQLATEKSEWKKLAAAVAQVLETA